MISEIKVYVNWMAQTKSDYKQWMEMLDVVHDYVRKRVINAMQNEF